MYSEIGNRFYVRASETDFNNMTRSGYFFGKLVQNTPDGTTDSNWIIEVQAFETIPAGHFKEQPDHLIKQFLHVSKTMERGATGKCLPESRI